MVKMMSILAVLGIASGAQAAEGVHSVEFIEGWRGDDGAHYSAIRIDLEDGWKTYWRAPQGSGIPPILAVRRGGNIQDVELLFPKPNLYEEFGESVLGYMDAVTFPIVFNLENAKAETELNSRFSFAVCKDVCIPLNFSIETILSPDQSSGTSAVKTALNAGPTNPAKVGLKRSSCKTTPSGTSHAVQAQFSWPFSQMPEMVVVEYPNDAYWVAPASTKMSASGLNVQSEIKYYGTGASILERNKMRISILTDDYIFEFTGC